MKLGELSYGFQPNSCSMLFPLAIQNCATREQEETEKSHEITHLDVIFCASGILELDFDINLAFISKLWHLKAEEDNKIS